MENKEKTTNEYIYGVGKRKTSIATVKVYHEKGDITIDNKTINEYFKDNTMCDIVVESLNLLNQNGKNKITIKVKGGGKNGQAEAIRLGISRCLVKMDPEARKTLKSQGYLTRDPRVKERKKPGLKRARKAPQWAKR